MKPKDKTLGKFIFIGIWFNSTEGIEHMLQKGFIKKRCIRCQHFGHLAWIYNQMPQYGHYTGQHNQKHYPLGVRAWCLNYSEKPWSPTIEYDKIGTENRNTDPQSLDLRARYSLNLETIYYHIPHPYKSQHLETILAHSPNRHKYYSHQDLDSRLSNPSLLYLLTPHTTIHRQQHISITNLHNNSKLHHSYNTK
ncbi:hypothetical protein N7452_004270 [Penicillium brevicompactum]|uniref:Uncharacterized protein n=1 Tax=Penicillium brevicompactum TaxID=5074 RepID=A0A9W9QV80_PENBR|nr:hypothetical protein N7452_004270 [Penicillium brevicompactum]